MIKEILNEYAIITSLIVLLPIIKFIHYIIVSNRTVKIRALALLQDAYLNQDKTSHRLVVEQMFQQIYKVNINYEIIKMLLELPNPTKSITLYKTSIKYLTRNGDILEFKKNTKVEYIER